MRTYLHRHVVHPPVVHDRGRRLVSAAQRTQAFTSLSKSNGLTSVVLGFIAAPKTVQRERELT
jgi:hypothetical protein